ncbi:MAG: MFS transporter [Gemmatimonadetes bacterium]|nr:MFS transporter [Gemmatimonadota bacterium]
MGERGVRQRVLTALGLDRRDVRAWAMYDWALSAQETTIAVAVFPIYFLSVAAADLPATVAAQSIAYANSAEIALVALLSPVLGAMADYAAVKKRLLASFMMGGVLATAAMFLVQRGDHLLAVVLFMLAGLGAQGSRVFYEALLPHLAGEADMDRVSTAGYALGYVGGGILLALNLAWIQHPSWFGLPSGPGLSPGEATLPARLAFLSVSVWWALFSIPLFRSVREPAARMETDERRGMNPARVGFARLVETFGELMSYRQAFLMLLAFLIYNDGISTIQKMATTYGTEIGIGQGDLIAAILIVQFVGIPFTFLFGLMAGRMGAKRSILAGLLVFMGISVFGYFLRTATQFYFLALLVGLVQGGTQALSRSLFASIIPRHKSGEFFGFYSVFSRFAAVFGPLVFGLVLSATGTSRSAILSIVVFFIVGGGLLLFVDVEEGKREAARAEAALVPARG